MSKPDSPAARLAAAAQEYRDIMRAPMGEAAGSAIEAGNRLDGALAAYHAAAKPRRIESMVPAPTPGGADFAVCNDGTAWMLVWDMGRPKGWHALPPIPQVEI